VSDLRRRLERIDVPGEHEVRGRAWEVVRGAFAEREPSPRPRRAWRPALVFAVAAAVLAGALSPPGRALIRSVREAIGVPNAAPALFDLPSSGRLLVTSARGSWVVQQDGSKRLLGRYAEASWSPFGRFVVAARANELAALEPGSGDLRWSLARPAVRRPRWGGKHGDTRVAYLSGSTLRVVAGDGTGDRLLAGHAARVAPAWVPASVDLLAFADDRGRIALLSAAGGRVLWRTGPGTPVIALAWSADGRRLLVVRRDRVDVRTRAGALSTGVRTRRGTVVDAAFRPGSHALAYAVADRGRSQVYLLGRPARVLFSGPGRFGRLAWSPDGRWLLVSWADADQWVFLRPDAAGRVQAVSAISRQFRAQAFPRVEGWCCAGDASGGGDSPRSASRTTAGRVVRSRAVGLPWRGRLVAGRQLPAEGAAYFTWDPIRKRVPNRAWRRWGTDRLLVTLRRVLREFAAANPGAPRIGVGDLSRPHGGDFGVRYGAPGHVSHQNGLDVDVYYPRRDRAERAARAPAEVDRALAQELVDRFARAGAVKIFVGPHVALTGDPAVVQPLSHHDNHLHVRLAGDGS
jgi:hypothetical protein